MVPPYPKKRGTVRTKRKNSAAVGEKEGGSFHALAFLLMIRGGGSLRSYGGVPWHVRKQDRLTGYPIKMGRKKGRKEASCAPDQSLPLKKKGLIAGAAAGGRRRGKRISRRGERGGLFLRSSSHYHKGGENLIANGDLPTKKGDRDVNSFACGVMGRQGKELSLRKSSKTTKKS